MYLLLIDLANISNKALQAVLAQALAAAETPSILFIHDEQYDVSVRLPLSPELFEASPGFCHVPDSLKRARDRALHVSGLLNAGAEGQQIYIASSKADKYEQSFFRCPIHPFKTQEQWDQAPWAQQ